MPELQPIPETKTRNGRPQPPAPRPKIPSTGSETGIRASPSSSRDRTFGQPPSSRDRTFGPPSSSRDRTFAPQKVPSYYVGPKSRSRHRSSCCCRCFLWSTLIILILIVLFGASIGVFFAIYHPRDTTFSVSSIRLSKFQVTPNDQLLSTLILNISTRNPSDSKFHYVYSNVSISIFSSDNIWIGDGDFPAYDHAGGETVVLSAIIQNDGNVLDAPTAASLRKKTSLKVMIEMDSKAGIKAGSLEIDNVRIRVACKDVMLPTRKNLPTTVTPAAATCRTKIKIFKWYI